MDLRFGHGTDAEEQGISKVDMSSGRRSPEDDSSQQTGQYKVCIMQSDEIDRRQSATDGPEWTSKAQLKASTQHLNLVKVLED
jgi:hypothetical protein